MYNSMMSQLSYQLDPEQLSFSAFQLEGYLFGILAAPIEIPKHEWMEVILGGPITSAVDCVAEVERQQVALLELITNRSYWGADPQGVDLTCSEVNAWSQGFTSALTDFSYYFNQRIYSDMKFAEAIEMLKFPISYEQVMNTISQLEGNESSLLLDMGQRFSEALMQVALSEQITHTIEPAHSLNPKVSALREAAAITDQVAIAQAILLEDSNCAEAWDVMARYKSENIEQMQACLIEAVRSGEHYFGAEYVQYKTGQFGELREGQQWLTSIVGLAMCLRKQNKLTEAAGYFEKALILDANDFADARAPLINCYFELARLDAVANILAFYDEDTAWVAYSRALLAFKREGSSDVANHLRKQAKTSNKWIPKVLSGRAKRVDVKHTNVMAGSKDEAMIYALDALQAWRLTPGAIPWLLS